MKKILMIFAVLLIFVCQVSANSVGLNNVSIIPGQPSNTDSITFSISGITSSTFNEVAYDLFSQNGTALQLDLYVDMGFFAVIDNWNYSKQILPLAPATYNLEVRAFDNYYDTLEDTYNLNFTVVPEPATIALLGLSLPFLRILSARRREK